MSWYSSLPLFFQISHLVLFFFFLQRAFLFSVVGGRRDWAVSWPPIGSSNPLTPRYVWNVSLFSAQSQPARFQVETRQGQEGPFLGVCLGGQLLHNTNALNLNPLGSSVSRRHCLCFTDGSISHGTGRVRLSLTDEELIRAEVLLRFAAHLCLTAVA